MKCPSCGTQVPVDDLDCTQCGASVGWWIRTRSGEELGPYTFLTMQEMLRRRQLGPLDRVRIGLIGEWTPAPEVLRPDFQRPAPPPTAVERPVVRRTRRSPTVLLVLAGAAVVALGGAVVAYRSTRPRPPRGADAVCLRNLASLGRGLQAYADEHDGTLPPWQSWGAAALVRAGDPSAFVCPAMPHEPGYAYNAALSGVAVIVVRRPAHCALLWDAGAMGSFPGLSPTGQGPRHRGGDNWAFVDGHVAWQARLPALPEDLDLQP
jgi:prepilin-type processing-associated H-X9-DG protein